MATAAARTETNWYGWDHVLSVLLEGVFFLDRFGNPAKRLRNLFRFYGYIGNRELLAQDELPENGVEGFRLQFSETQGHVTFIRRQDGSIYVHSTVESDLYRFEASYRPSAIEIEQFQAAIDHLLAS